MTAEPTEHGLRTERVNGRLVSRCKCDTGHKVGRTTLRDSYPGRGVWYRATCSCGWSFEHTDHGTTERVLADHIAGSHNAAGAANHKGEAR